MPTDADKEWANALEAQMTHWNKVVKMVCDDPAFHLDAYSSCQHVMIVALEAALGSGSLGVGAEEDELRRILEQVRHM